MSVKKTGQGGKNSTQDKNPGLEAARVNAHRRGHVLTVMNGPQRPSHT